MYKNEWFQWRAEVLSCRQCPNITKVWLGALATFANEKGWCHPNQEQIAKAMGRETRSKLYRCSTQAAECGHIVIGSAKRSNNYQLTLANVKVNDPHLGLTTTPKEEPVTPPLTPKNPSTLIAASNMSYKTGDNSIKNSLTHFLANTQLMEARDNAESN